MAHVSKKDVRMVFFGTPDFAVGVLESLKDAGMRPILIVTAPDRPAGRGMTLTAPPAKVWAEKEGIDVLQPEKITTDVIDELQNSEWDLFLVAAYGQILPKALLDIPHFGTLNVHPSLLPKLRGASPIETAILDNVKDAVGITIMQMDEKMDHGPLLAQARIELEDWPERASTLRALFAREGGNLLAETIPEWLAGSITPEPQDHTQATFSKKFEKSDAEVNLSDDPFLNFCKIRAFDVSPRAFFFAEKDGKKVRVVITDAEYTDGKLTLTRVIPEGKKEMPYSAFLKTL